MKLLALAAMAALIVSGQAVSNPQVAAKPAAKEASLTPAPTERALSETEALKLKLAATQIELLQKKFDIENYNKELKPIQAEQEAVAMAACRSVGIPEEVIRTQCGLNFGGAGPDGKPMAAKVWWNRPATEKK